MGSIRIWDYFDAADLRLGASFVVLALAVPAVTLSRRPVVQLLRETV